MNKKNIAFLIENYLAGGCDSIARDLIDNLDYHRLYLYVNKGSDLKILLRNKLPNNVELIEYNIISIPKLGMFANNFKEKNKIVYGLLKFFNLMIRYPILVLYIIYFFLLFRKVNIDVFFSNNGGYPGGECNRMASIAFSFLRGRNYHIVHNLATKPFFKLFTPIEYFIDYILDKVSVFVCVSNQTKEYLLQNRYIKSSPIVIYNGVESNIKVVKKIKSSTIRLLNIGLLGKRKNQLLLVEALDRLKLKGYKNIELHLLGDEEDIGYIKMLKEKISRYNLDNIYFQGFCDPYEYYNKCDIFILSSVVESFALVRVEAMSVGMPVITTDVGDAYMQIENNYNGYIVNSLDEMVIAIERYINNTQLIEEHAHNGKIIYNNKFTKDKMIEQYQRLIDED